MAYLGNPTITPKDLYAADATALISKKSMDFTAKTYQSAQEQMSDMKPMWIWHFLTLAMSFLDLPNYIEPFLSFDGKLYLRGGLLHIEQGKILPKVSKGYGENQVDYPKVGEDLVIKRQEFLRHYHEEAGKEPIHVTAVVDQRVFDHAEKIPEFSTYKAMLSAYTRSLVSSINIFLTCAFNAVILGFTRGLIFLEKGSELERFFQPTGKDITPEEQYSKNARDFYTGEAKKILKDLCGEAMEKLKNIIVYDPDTVVDFVSLLSRPATIREISSRKVEDISDLSKIKAYYKKTYLKEEGGKFKLVDITRRKSLEGLVSALRYHIRSASLSPKFKYMMQYENSKDQKNEIQIRGKLNYSDTVVLMNDADLADMGYLTGSSVESEMTSASNPYFSELKINGVSFLGMEVIAPGWAVCISKRAFQFIYYFDEIYKEFFPLQMVNTWIRHYFLRIAIFKYFPGFVLCPSKFSPHAEWIREHIDEITK